MSVSLLYFQPLVQGTGRRRRRWKEIYTYETGELMVVLRTSENYLDLLLFFYFSKGNIYCTAVLYTRESISENLSIQSAEKK